MSTKDDQEQAIEILQQLGLKEYEANCYVGLSRVEDATAKELSEITSVPRTRVYDAIRVLEARGLVEIQHANPKRFRSVPLTEAIDTLRSQFEDRFESLGRSIRNLDSVEHDREAVSQEVWALTGSDAIANRTEQLLAEATEEVVFVIGEESLCSDELLEALGDVPDGVTVDVGTLSSALAERIEDAVPDAAVFVSGLEWLRGETASQETAIGRMLLVDRETILMSTYDPRTGEEHAVFGRGFGNGLVVIVRRLLETGILPVNRPST